MYVLGLASACETKLALRLRQDRQRGFKAAVLRRALTQQSSPAVRFAAAG